MPWHPRAKAVVVYPHPCSGCALKRYDKNCQGCATCTARTEYIEALRRGVESPCVPSPTITDIKAALKGIDATAQAAAYHARSLGRVCDVDGCRSVAIHRTDVGSICERHYRIYRGIVDGGGSVGRVDDLIPMDMRCGVEGCGSYGMYRSDIGRLCVKHNSRRMLWLKRYGTSPTLADISWQKLPQGPPSQPGRQATPDLRPERPRIPRKRQNYP